MMIFANLNQSADGVYHGGGPYVLVAMVGAAYALLIVVVWLVWHGTRVVTGLWRINHERDGAIAQQGEHVHGMHEVRGSTPRSST